MNTHQSYSNAEVCVIGYGCVLPQAGNPEQFWENLLAARCAIQEVPNERWDKSLYCSPNREAADKTYSTFGGYIDADIMSGAAQAAGVSSPTHSRLQIMTLAATQQALTNLDWQMIAPERVNIFLGCMDQDGALPMQKFLIDEEADLQRFIQDQQLPDGENILELIRRHYGAKVPDRKTIIKNLIPSSALYMVKERFGFKGEAALIDAACASSLAAIDISMMMLKSGECDLVLCGGVEANIQPETYVLFSKVGALADEPCRPLDSRSRGLNQGEGAVVLVLERFQDAVRNGHPIHGVLRACGASSDGKTGSLFEPTVDGQLRAYERTQGNEEKKQTIYVEAHATGTTIGDTIETTSLQQFFAGHTPYIGSVKALLGHTKAAAGAVSLLKCLLSLKHRILPPSPYFQSGLTAGNEQCQVNTQPLALDEKLSPLRFGVSSFGFGGINYHLVLEEYLREHTLLDPEVNPRNNVVICGIKTMSTELTLAEELAKLLHLPPRSLPQIDKVQISALVAVHHLAQELHIDLSSLDKPLVTVISASTLGLDHSRHLAKRVIYFEMMKALASCPEETITSLINYKEKYPPVTEDTGPGILNNVIAGRIANVFDLQGSNFNVEAELNSLACALRIAAIRLSHQNGMVIVVGSHDQLNEQTLLIDRPEVSCYFLASLDFARQYNLPIRSRLTSVEYVHHDIGSKN